MARVRLQILARCTEQDASATVHRSGPKVDDIIKARVFTAEKYGWGGLVEEYHADAALRQKRDLDKGQPEHVPRTLGEPVSPQEADAFCRLAATMQCGAAAARITAAPVLPDSERLRQRLREKLHPVEDMPEKAERLMKLRLERLHQMQSLVTPQMLHELDELLAKRATTLKPHKKKGRTGWRFEYIRQFHATRAGPILRRMAIHFILGFAPLEVYMRYAHVSLSPRDKGRGDDDPRPVGAPEPFWRWSVGSANKLLEAHAKKVLHPHQFAIGVSSGAEKMGKLTSFEAAQLSEHAWVIPDVKNAYCELDREETVNDCCEWHPLAGAMVIALHTVPTVYVHDNRGAPSRRYTTADGVIQGCGFGMTAFCVVQRKPVEWITKTAEAAGRGVEDLPDFICKPPNDVRTHMRKWLSENRIAQPTKDSTIVVSRHYADNGTYGVVPELAAQLPALASTCMAVKGLTYKSTWEAWAPFAVTLDGGDAWTFDVKKPEEGLILVGGELGPIDASLFIGSENFIRTKLFKKAMRIGGYLQTLVSVVAAAAKAYHAERHVFRVLKYTARSRAQYFLKVFSPETTEHASRIVDDEVKKAELALLGWSAEEARKACGQANLGFEHGGHDMQPRTDDRYMLHLAAWLDSMDQQGRCSA